MKANINWYSPNKQLLDDVASFSYANILGQSTDILGLPFANDGVFPGVCIVDMDPQLGVGDKSTDAPTVAAGFMYSFVRHSNSGHSNYESPDLMMYTIAHNSITSLIHAGARAYGLAQYYTHKNAYFGKALVEACGFNYSDLIKRLADFRAGLNLRIDKLNSRLIPAGMPIGERWKWLNSSVFVDDDDVKAQIIVPRFRSYFQLDSYGAETGTQLLYREVLPFVNTLLTVDEYLAHLDELLEPLLAEEDFGIMSGDIEKAYGRENCASIAYIPDTYVCTPVLDNDYLMEFHNACTVPGLPADTDGFKIETIGNPDNAKCRVYQENGVIKTSFVYTNAVLLDDSVRPTNFLLDHYKQSPTAADNMMATRGICYGEWTGMGPASFKLTTACSDSVRQFVIMRTPDAMTRAGAAGYEIVTNFTSYESIAPVLMSYFDWHPHLYVFDPVAMNFAGVVGDLQEYTTISVEKLKAFNRIALLQMLTSTAKNKLR